MAGDENEELLRQLTEWYEGEKFDKPGGEKLRKYLIGSKYRLEVAKKKISGSLSGRRDLRDFFGDRDPQNEITEELLNSGVLVPLPGPAGQSVVLMSRPFQSGKTHRIRNVAKAYFMSLDLKMAQDDDIATHGLDLVCDVSGISFGTVFQCTPRYLMEVIRILLNCYPVAFKSMHVFNCPRIVHAVMAVFKVLIGSKMGQRIHSYGADTAGLVESLGAARLPAEYGGTAGSFAELTQQWKQVMDSHRQDFLNEEYW